ncbi:MAG: efflux RND transporter periplasmic adaptor subunit [Hyphomicrobiaceae bacterium]|nr:efflux RND transporter periplasmic adaptor subunit [Hyphomicrobiaceae bacterium]
MTAITFGQGTFEVNKPIDPRERLKIEQVLAMGRAVQGRWLVRPEARWAAAAGAAFVVLVLLWSLRGGSAAVRYLTDPVQRGSLIVVVTATGSVQPTNKVDVSSELSGTVRKVHVDYNSLVKAGQPLAELDTDKLVATVASSRARLSAARAKVSDAKATVLEKQQDVVRKRLLASRQVTSGHDLEIAEAAHERARAGLLSAEADVGVAEADLKLNETNLAKAIITSPIGGVVLKRSVDPGQTVASNFQAPVLFSIAEDLSKMELQVDVDEADVGKVKVGQSASFTVDAFPERRFPAAIRDVRFASETIQGVVTYKAVLTIDNSELLLRPGMTATAEIRVTEIADAVLVANAALRYSPPAASSGDNRSFLQRILPGRPPFREASKREDAGNNRTVWILKEGKPAPVPVTVGATDGRRTVVTSGKLETGQQVVTDQIAPKS